jgi:hypothetical protein
MAISEIVAPARPDEVTERGGLGPSAMVLKVKNASLAAGGFTYGILSVNHPGSSAKFGAGNTTGCI